MDIPTSACHLSVAGDPSWSRGDLDVVPTDTVNGSHITESWRTNLAPAPPMPHWRARKGGASSLAKLVGAVGTDQFTQELLNYLHEICGADNFSIFSLYRDNLHIVSTRALDNRTPLFSLVARYASTEHWRMDPMMRNANASCREGALLVRKCSTDLVSHELQEDVNVTILDRIVICGRAGGGNLSLSILKSDRFGLFSDAQLQQIATNSDLLFELIVKHSSVRAPIPNPTFALRSLIDIENCLSAMTELPKREMEVCARILLCQTSAGIALSLGISEESVKTYRCRAYKRLTIGGVRELWMWYLNLWYLWQQELCSSSDSSHKAACC